MDKQKAQNGPLESPLTRRAALLAIPSGLAAALAACTDSNEFVRITDIDLEKYLSAEQYAKLKKEVVDALRLQKDPRSEHDRDVDEDVRFLFSYDPATRMRTDMNGPLMKNHILFLLNSDRGLVSAVGKKVWEESKAASRRKELSQVSDTALIRAREQVILWNPEMKRALFRMWAHQKNQPHNVLEALYFLMPNAEKRLYADYSSSSQLRTQVQAQKQRVTDWIQKVFVRDASPAEFDYALLRFRVSGGYELHSNYGFRVTRPQYYTGADDMYPEHVGAVRFDR